MAYIDRETAIKIAVANYKCDNQFDAMEMVEAMENIPTADVEEVVRCPDCIYCDNMKCTELKDNTGHLLDVAIFDYCSQGVRKERRDT